MDVLPKLPFTWDSDGHFRIPRLLTRALRTEIEAVVTTTKTSRPDPWTFPVSQEAKPGQLRF